MTVDDITIVHDTIWMSENAIAKLFDTTKNNISLHMKHILKVVNWKKM